MSKHYPVSLPVKPYVLKYVQTIEGSNYLEFKSSSMLCTIIRAYMENKSYTGLSKTQMETAISTRTAKLVIQVPMRKMHIIGTTIRPDGILMINSFLEQWFENALVAFMKENTRAEGRYKGYKDALYAFAELYHIELEEDISYDGLKKMDYRARKLDEQGNRKRSWNIFSNLVPSF